eukprot:TRINITY_DN2825_c0_g2_i1.p1 TRINITY_DN2825_c0_g2~~TRINITY_DN2825_c0_g2_i1.p1  ORF type:complete len:201 (-),score=65.90 TRINITY_DN2825_c0_g2_i1:27-629(-)
MRQCTREELESLNEVMAQNVEPKQLKKALKKVKKRIEAEEKAREEDRLQREKKRLDASRCAGKRPWTDEELVLLRQAVNKFPGGTIERWTKIRRHMNEKRSEQEIIDKLKEIKKGGRKMMHRPPGSQQGQSAAPEWSAAQQKALENALKETKGVAGVARWDKIAEMVEGKDRKECIARFKELREKVMDKKEKVPTAWPLV